MMTRFDDEAEGRVLCLCHRIRAYLVRNKVTLRRVERKMLCHALGAVVSLLLFEAGLPRLGADMVGILCVIAIEEFLDGREGADR